MAFTDYMDLTGHQSRSLSGYNKLPANAVRLLNASHNALYRDSGVKRFSLPFDVTLSFVNLDLLTGTPLIPHLGDRRENGQHTNRETRV